MSIISEEIDEANPRGIAAAISRLVTDGRLEPGDRLPTVRELATELGVSPATVSSAWQSLGAAGLIVSRGRSGSFVRQLPREWMPQRYRGLDRELERGREARLDLSRGTPDPALLPPLAPAIARLADTFEGSAATSSYQLKPDIPELHDLMRESWPAPVESLTIVNGALDGVDRALGTLVRFGDRIAVENPIFPPFADLVDQLGLVALPFGLDAEGPDVASFRRALGQAPRAVLLQPRAHNPTGVSLSAARAAELAGMLRRIAAAEHTVVIEDDHSWAISSAPAVSLASWLPERVIHVRSFAKSHGPDLRIGALGGPRPLVDRIVARRLLGPGWTSRMTQALLFELLTDPAAQAQVARARELYAARQAEFAEALSAAGLTASGRPQAIADGVNAWVRVADERAAMARLAAAGVLAAPGSPFRIGTDGLAHLRLTVGIVGERMSELAGLVAEAAA